VTAKNLGSISRRGFSREDVSQAHVRTLLLPGTGNDSSACANSTALTLRAATGSNIVSFVPSMLRWRLAETKPPGARRTETVYSLRCDILDGAGSQGISHLCG
jgi:hypothetical protein